MITAKALLPDYQRKLLKALNHLKYSFAKVQTLPTKASDMDEQSLETWESFTSRFARVVDLFLTKYVRTKVLIQDPGFQGSLRDIVDYAEKIQILENADFWMDARALRNIEAHDYTEEDLEAFLKSMLVACPRVLAIESVVSGA